MYLKVVFSLIIERGDFTCIELHHVCGTKINMLFNISLIKLIELVHPFLVFQFSVKKGLN
jgi:hypothetical protein